MPRPRPQLSITLPRNFTFHYTEGEEPKTPEREVPVPVARSPPRAANANAYRIKRRSRPAVTALFQQEQEQGPSIPNESPIPTIETSLLVEPLRPILQQRATEPPGQLAPVARKYMTLPRTPISQQRHLVDEWKSPRDVGDSISRPMSACSLISDSSDNDSNGSLLSFPAGDGSCTSPESDAADPFRFPSINKRQAKQWASLARNAEEIQNGLHTKQTHIHWTTEMDKHLWSTYLVYLQDPTVTPFKTLPGTAPPLGVCHRVAREARRSWKKPMSRKPSELLSPPTSGDEIAARADSPETIREERSGSNTPTGPTGSKIFFRWPKSGSSTRRRLRYLCKSKPTFAPHYQRLMKSRSPSPFSSPRTQARYHSRLSEVSSPIQPSSSFNTREIQLSLTTSTAGTMQPDGPLAQLASSPQQSSQSTEWFNEPPVPWASTPAISSDIDIDIGTNVDGHESPHAPPLGSPFGHHTWGPSRSRHRIRPSASRVHSSDASTVGPSFLGPSLRSPVRLNGTFPYPGVQKRRARHQLEDELSPGGSNMPHELLDDLFGSPPEGRHRRVRSRGFSLGDVATPNALESLFTPPTVNDQTMTTETSSHSSGSTNLEPLTTPSHVRRLGSPFHGISPRPPRTPSRHMATTSLGSYEPLPFASIGETLGQAENSGIFQGRSYR